MDHYIVSARKYRPSTFNTVIGQRALTAALKHAVATDRLAHAYLFCGSRGVGKTSCARIFAKTINCERRTPDGEACNECPSCQAFNAGTSFNIIELDAASHNSVDDIRGLTEQVMVPPTQGRYRVFIIDEVHMLSAAAFNAFLKTLEEPPEYVIFILATTEKHKIIPTILSRCQIYDFSRITIQDMVDHLSYVASSEGIAAEPAALNVIARKADGAMRDALSIFDQVAASTMGNVTYQNTIANLNILDNTYYTRLVDAFLRGDVPTALLIYRDIREMGFDSQFFVNGLAQYLRDLMVAMNPVTLPLLEATDDVRQEMAATASRCVPAFIYAAMDLCNDADLNFRAATNKQLLVELTLIKLCQLTAPKTAPATQQPLKPVQPATQQPQQQPATQQPQQPTSNQQQQQQRAPMPSAVSEPQPRPAYQPAQPRPAAANPATRHRVGSLPSMSIHGKRDDEKKADSSDGDPAGARQLKATKYSQEDLNKVWAEYIDTHPTERILINTMRAAPPMSVGPDKYVIEVDDAIQVETLNEAKPEILQMLRSRLANDYIDFAPAIREGGKSSPTTWTHREVLQHMIDKHDVLKNFITDLSLTL